MRQSFDVVILGAGAAGLLCAIEAGKRGRRVAVVERAERVGKKILISGGGRCNFTNLECTAENFLSENPHFCKSALARYTPADFLALVAKHKIPYHEKRPYPEAARGQLFCDRSATDIVEMLLAECAAAGVRIFLNAQVTEVRHDGGFVVRAQREELTQSKRRKDTGGTEEEEREFTGRKRGAAREGTGKSRAEALVGEDEFAASTLVVATGGLSIPKMGATPFGYALAKQFGHAIVPCRPGLVPLTLGRGEARAFCNLAGVSAVVEASCGGQSFREKMLITHRGLSGPAILQVSSYWKWKTDEGVRIDLAPGQEWTVALRDGVARRDVTAGRTALRKILPQRLADRWIERGLERREPKDWTNAGLTAIEEELHAWEVRPAGTEGYQKAEVTAGGVDTAELSSKTMESKKVRGLFFIGEVVDVTGWLGGFNFQWAWASGAAAGREV